MAKPKKFTVVGPHRVGGVNPGEVITLDPSMPQTVRLLARGQIASAPSRQVTPDADDAAPAEHTTESRSDPSPS